MPQRRSRQRLWILALAVFAVGAFGGGWWFFGFGAVVPPPAYIIPAAPILAEGESLPPEPEGPIFRATHLPTPEPLRAVYMTSWVAGTPPLRERLVKLVGETELNAIVIDVKDYTGKIAFNVKDPLLVDGGAAENRIPDVQEFIAELHRQGIYVIGRVSVFQDPHLVARRPELAVRRLSDGGIWHDRKGLTWIDPTAREAWDYNLAVAREAYAAGFDEINFDYIRFPSDGNMKDIDYHHFDSSAKTRAEAMEEFFAYLAAGLADLGLPTSADFFGLTTVNPDDLGIGQVLESALPHFDYLAPMVYPSHYASGFIGYANPAAHPYEVVKYSLDQANRRIATYANPPPLAAVATSTATTTSVAPTPPARPVRAKLRPWLQDFDLGAVYTAELVRAQMQATYDAGLSSWMMWDPSNKYTREAFELDDVPARQSQ